MISKVAAIVFSSEYERVQDLLYTSRFYSIEFGILSGSGLIIEVAKELIELCIYWVE